VQYPRCAAAMLTVPAAASIPHARVSAPCTSAWPPARDAPEPGRQPPGSFHDCRRAGRVADRGSPALEWVGEAPYHRTSPLHEQGADHARPSVPRPEGCRPVPGRPPGEVPGSPRCPGAWSAPWRVPVAYEVATALGAPLDVFLVRKLGVLGREELAMGAIARRRRRKSLPLAAAPMLPPGSRASGHHLDRPASGNRRQCRTAGEGLSSARWR
jgi:hypothetical protein